MYSVFAIAPCLIKVERSIYHRTTPQTKYDSLLMTNSQPETEIALLLSCARTQINPTIASQIKALVQQKIDWSKLIQLAEQHGTLPLLYQSLKVTCSESVPPVILDLLQKNFRNLALCNMSLTQELSYLLKQFETQSIAVIPYKGVLLASSVYGNLALRKFCDLDIWVDPNKFTAAKQLLNVLGYQSTKNLGWEDSFFHPTKEISVDLHRALMPDFFALKLDFKSVQSRLISVNLAGSGVASLSPEDLLLVLCSQFGKDCCHWRVRLAQLCDVAEVLQTYPEMNWNWVQSQAAALGIERIVLLTLAVIQDLLAAELPEEIVKRFEAEPTCLLLKKWVLESIWHRSNLPISSASNPGFWEFLQTYNHWFYLSMRERASDKIVYCWHWLGMCSQAMLQPNQLDQELVQLPRFLSLLYYPIHIIRLLIKYMAKSATVFTL